MKNDDLGNMLDWLNGTFTKEEFEPRDYRFVGKPRIFAFETVPDWLLLMFWQAAKASGA